MFSVDPAFCATAISGPTSDPKVPTTLCGDETCIKVPTIPDLGPFGPDPTDPTKACVSYPVVTTITVTNADATSRPVSITTTVEVCNPCLDADHVTITPPAAFPSVDYIIDQGALPIVAHGAFTVVTAPVANHSLCGALTYVPSFEDGTVPYDDTKT